MTLVRLLRRVSFCEGTSFAVLLLVAMPLKYLAGIAIAVRLVGWAHGLLFVAVVALAGLALLRGRLPWHTAALACTAALVPGGPFLMDRVLPRHEADTARLSR